MATPFPNTDRAARLGLSYRSARDADLDLLARIYASTRREEVAMTGWDLSTQDAFLAGQFEAQHRHYHEHYPNALWLVVQTGLVPVGRLYLEQWTKDLRIIDIALLPEFRGRGFGEAILHDLMDQAAGGGRAVSIHVEKTNPAMRLYLRLGFQVIEDKGVYDLLRWSADADQAKTAS